MPKLIILSGCSGGGKSTLLSQLQDEGYSVVTEVGREVYKEFFDIAASDPLFMCEKIIERSIVAYHKATTIVTPLDDVIFFDRSFLECVSYYQSLNRSDSNKYDYLIQELRYYPIILMTPPWKEIFVQDEERKHTFEEAVKEYELLVQSYPKYGYEMVVLPKVSVLERVEFVKSICASHLK